MPGMIAGLLFLCCATQARAQATSENLIFQADPSSMTPLKLAEAKMTAVSSRRPGLKPGTKSNKYDMPYLSDDDVKGILSKSHRSTNVVKHFILNWAHQVARLGGGGTIGVIGRCTYSESDEPRFYFWLNGISKKDPGYYTEYPQWIGVKYQPPLGANPSKLKPPSFLVIYNLLASDDVPSGGKPEVDGGICDPLLRHVFRDESGPERPLLLREPSRSKSCGLHGRPRVWGPHGNGLRAPARRLPDQPLAGTPPLEIAL